jgi:hypothetical protein
MMRVVLLGAALVAAGIAVFCLCPGNLFGPEWLVVQTPDGPTDGRNPPASDWWVLLGSALCLAGLVVPLVGRGGPPPVRAGRPAAGTASCSGHEGE